jgi:nucleotide-binding universal stress UspA family protein
MAESKEPLGKTTILRGPILVPLDGSDLAARAVAVAADFARRAKIDLRLLHVHVPITARSTSRVGR